MNTTSQAPLEPNSGLPWGKVIVTGIVAALGYFVVNLVQRRRLYRDLPKPPHSFFWGHLKLFGEITDLFPKDCSIQILVTTMVHKYKLPGVFYLDLWPLGPSMCIVTDPDVAQHLTVTRNHEKHNEEAKAMDPLIGNANIATSEGARWKTLHKMLAPAFSVMHVTNQRPMFAEAVMEFRATLNKLAATEEVFELEKYVEGLALDVIGAATFGHSLGAQAGKSEVMEHWDTMSRAHLKLRESWKVDVVRKYLVYRRRETAKKKLDKILTELVEKRFAFVVGNDVSLEKRKDSIIIDMMLRDYLQDSPQSNQKRLDSNFLETVLTQVRALIVGGTGTTTDTACFMYMLLSAHPDIIQKLREEHDRVFAPGIDASYEILCAEPYRLNNLGYTTNVIKEVLRHYPVGPTARKEQTEGFIPYDGQRYTTKGCLILPVQHTMHMNPDLFPNPKEFDPERFTREDFPRHAWRPFERGPRACLGQPLAMDELKTMLLLTIREFDFACAGLQPNEKPRVPWTDLDLTFGDRAFQEYVFEAKPRDRMPMSVKESGWTVKPRTTVNQ